MRGCTSGPWVTVPEALVLVCTLNSLCGGPRIWLRECFVSLGLSGPQYQPSPRAAPPCAGSVKSSRGPSQLRRRLCLCKDLSIFDN